MMIQNFDRSYQIMRHLGYTKNAEELLCREHKSRGADAVWLLVRMEDPICAKGFTIFLEEKVKGREFTDYEECFQADGAFYAVFRYSLEEKLTDRLEAEMCSRRERLEIARKLLERLLLLNPHPYFAVNALRPEQITVSRSLDVSWNYHFDKIEDFDTVLAAQTGRSLSLILRLLFWEEEEKRLFPVLEDYLRRLLEETDWSYLEYYQNFMPVYRELMKEQSEEPQPKTFGFRLWEKLKKVFGFLKKVLAVVILLAAVWYVVHTFQDDSGSHVTVQTMRQVGDLEIE